MRGKNVILEWSVRARCVHAFWQPLFVVYLKERRQKFHQSSLVFVIVGVRKTVHLRKALFDISKESEMKIMIQGKMAFRVKEKCTRTFKNSLVSRISWNG